MIKAAIGAKHQSPTNVPVLNAYLLLLDSGIILGSSAYPTPL